MIYELAKITHLVIQVKLCQFELLNKMKILSMHMCQLARYGIMRTDSYVLH